MDAAVILLQQLVAPDDVTGFLGRHPEFNGGCPGLRSRLEETILDLGRSDQSFNSRTQSGIASTGLFEVGGTLLFVLDLPCRQENAPLVGVRLSHGGLA